MEPKPKDQCGVAPEEHKGRGQDSHWEGRKCLNSLTMTKWWGPVMLSGVPSSHPSLCLIPEWWEHSFLQLLARELWAVLYSMCRNLLSTNVYINQGHEFLSEQQCWDLGPKLKRRLVRDKLWQVDRQPLVSPLHNVQWTEAPNTIGVQAALSFSLFVFTITFWTNELRFSQQQAMGWWELFAPSHLAPSWRTHSFSGVLLLLVKTSAQGCLVQY